MDLRNFVSASCRAYQGQLRPIKPIKDETARQAAITCHGRPKHVGAGPICEREWIRTNRVNRVNRD